MACCGFSRSKQPHQQVELLLRIDGEVELLDRLHGEVFRGEIQRPPARACSARPGGGPAAEWWRSAAASAATAGNGAGSSRCRGGSRCPTCGRPRRGPRSATRPTSARRGSSGPARGPAFPPPGRPRVKLLDLFADRLAAVDGHDVECRALGQLDALVADLDGQFAGGHQDQGLRRPGLADAA